MRGRVDAAGTYVAALSVLGAGAVVAAIIVGPDWRNVLALFLLHGLAEGHVSSIWHDRVSITLSSIVVMAAILIVGPAGVVLVELASAYSDRKLPLIKRAFNVSQAVLCAGAAGLVFERLGGHVGHLVPDDFPDVLGPLLAADLTYCLLNALLISTVIRLSPEQVPIASFLRVVLLPSAATYLAYGLFGLLLAVLWLNGLGVAAALLLLSPLLIAGWVLSQYAAEQEAYEATVRALVQAVETKDFYTRGHNERVSHGSVMIARQLGMGADRVDGVRFAGMLHDLGKIGVPTRLLHKTGRLAEDEFAALKLHPRRGVEMVEEIEFLDEARKGILHHHERLDGLGYPMGLRGMAIPEFARVIAVVDAFDAMTTVRSYRGARSLEEARHELVRSRGTQLDPGMVDAFLTALDRDGWVPAAVDAVSEELVAPGSGALPISDHDDPTAPMPPSRPPSSGARR